MCADEQLSFKREPYFPGNYEWAPGGGERWLQGGRARALLDKRSFFHFSWRRQVSASLSNVTHLLPPASPLPLRSSLSLFRCERALFMHSSVYFRENRPRGEEERRTSKKKERKKKRVAAGCGDLFLASYRSRSPAWSVDRTGADASQVPQKGCLLASFFSSSFFFLLFFFSYSLPLLRQIAHRSSRAQTLLYPIFNLVIGENCILFPFPSSEYEHIIVRLLIKFLNLKLEINQESLSSNS